MQITNLIVCCAFLASACTSVNYNEGSSRPFLTKATDASGSLNEGIVYYDHADDEAPKELIAENDYFSIKLISAFICNFRESKGFAESKETSNKYSKVCNNYIENTVDESGDRQATRGEILIAANVGEQKSGLKIGFDLASVRNGSKVVYYNPDIRESGQLINAINLPVYGPKKYEGFPFLMDISVFELDNDENKEIKALLSKLADLGAAASANPLINSVVKPLGEALVAGSNADDLEMRYIMNFDEPGALDSTVKRMQLREGYYAIVRKEARDKIAYTKTLCVDSTTGLVLELKTEKLDCKLKVTDEPGNNNVYRDSTWLLFRIAKEDPQSPAIDQVDTLEALSSFLARDKNWDTSFADQQAAIQQLTTNLDARAQISLIDKQIKTQLTIQPDFKKLPEYAVFLLEKLTTIDTNNALSYGEQLQLEINKNVIDRLSRVVVNMPCLPNPLDKVNYGSQVTSLKMNMTLAKINRLSDGSGLLRVTGITDCH